MIASIAIIAFATYSKPFNNFSTTRVCYANVDHISYGHTLFADATRKPKSTRDCARRLRLPKTTSKAAWPRAGVTRLCPPTCRTRGTSSHHSLNPPQALAFSHGLSRYSLLTTVNPVAARPSDYNNDRHYPLTSISGR